MAGQQQQPAAVNPGAITDLESLPTSFAGKSAQEMFLAHLFYNLNRFTYVLSTMGSTNDPRLVPLAKTIVGMLPDRLKEQLSEIFRKELRDVTASDYSIEEKGDYRLEISQEAISKVYSIIWQLFPIHTQDVEVPLVDYPPDWQELEGREKQTEPETDEEETVTDGD